MQPNKPDAEQAWRVVHRVTYDGWNVVVGDGLHIGPFEYDKANAIVRDHNTELAATHQALTGTVAALEEFQYYRIGTSAYHYDICVGCGYRQVPDQPHLHSQSCRYEAAIAKGKEVLGE